MSFCDNLLRTITRVFGKKRGGCKRVADVDSQLLRFFSQSPNFLDDPTDEASFRDRARKALELRDKDGGRLSFWETVNASEREHATAQHGIRRGKLERLTMLGIRRAWAESRGFGFSHERDNDAFDCVADLHRTVKLVPDHALDRFIDELRRALLGAHANHNTSNEPAVTHESLSKDVLRNLIAKVARECPALDRSRLAVWVRREVSGETERG